MNATIKFNRRNCARSAPPRKSTRLLAIGFFSMVLMGAITWAHAQQPAKVFRIGILAYDQKRSDMEPFLEELNRLGYADQNAKIELWNAEGRAERLAELAEELSRFKPDVVLASSTPPSLAAKKALPTTPIVFTQVADPVGVGLVASFANPGGYLTGVTNMNVELSGKRTQLLMETFPTAKRIGVLTNPTDPIGAAQVKEMSRMVDAAKRGLEVLNISDPKEFQNLPALLKKQRVDAVSLVTSQIFAGHRAELFATGVSTKTPIMYWNGSFVAAGGLMAYGVNAQELYRRAAYYVDRILKGTKPADLPVEPPKQFELHINLKIAKQSGLTIPPDLLWRATKVIQ